MQQYYEPLNKKLVARIHRTKSGNYAIMNFRTFQTTFMSAEKFTKFIKIGVVNWWKNPHTGVYSIYRVDPKYSH